MFVLSLINDIFRLLLKDVLRILFFTILFYVNDSILVLDLIKDLIKVVLNQIREDFRLILKVFFRLLLFVLNLVLDFTVRVFFSLAITPAYILVLIALVNFGAILFTFFNLLLL